jgi:hypothetical protein
MSSTLRSFHQTTVDSRFVVTDATAAAGHLFNVNGAGDVAVLPTNSSSYIVAADLAVGTVLVDLGYELFVGQIQYRRVGLLHDPTKYAHIAYRTGPAALPGAWTSLTNAIGMAGLARI